MIAVTMTPVRIPITMSHGPNRGPYMQPSPRWREKNPIDGERFENYFRIAAELGFESISYDDLACWRAGAGELPPRPILFDFDHPNRSIHRVVFPIMERFGFRGNLFINTSPMEKTGDWRFMTWDEVRELMGAGWHIASHMHNHYDLSYLGRVDPTGRRICEQLEKCDGILEEHLGIVPRDFAYTGTTWSRVAEGEVRKRYRFGRLWTIGSHYDTDAGRVRYAELVGASGSDEADGGPPVEARYITRETEAYKLPSMDLEYLIYPYEAFRRYLEGAAGP